MKPSFSRRARRHFPVFAIAASALTALGAAALRAQVNSLPPATPMFATEATPYYPAPEVPSAQVASQVDSYGDPYGSQIRPINLEVVGGEPIWGDASYPGYPGSVSGPMTFDGYGEFREDYEGFVSPQPRQQGRQGFFQRVSATGTWLYTPQDGDFGVVDGEIFGVFALPAPTAECPLLLTPYFAVHVLDGPVAPDMPPRIHDASLQLRWLPRIGQSLRLDLAAEPGVHSDFQKYDDDELRFPGHAMAIVDWSPTTKIVFGALYLDREDFDVLPAGGVIFNPWDGFQLDLLFPKPKIAWRYSNDGWKEVWSYFAAEFGGGPYSIQRTSGAQDVVILSDYRVFYGIEHQYASGFTSRLEVGYVFGRELEYVSGTTYDPDDTFIVRAGASF